MSIGINLQILVMLGKRLAELRERIEQETLEGLPPATIGFNYPYNVGYLKAIRDIETVVAEVERKLKE